MLKENVSIFAEIQHTYIFVIGTDSIPKSLH